jgi:glycosyltransferase involved in cell wall biosynthesis
VFKNLKVCVVIPAYKEELLIAETILGIPDFVDHIVVIDDHSPDKTYEIATKFLNDPRFEGRLQVLRLPQNQGVGGAIIAGHKAALELGADVSVVMAGDNQMDPAYLPDLLNPIAAGEYDFTKGNRFFAADALKGMPKYRVIGNAALGFLTKFASGYWKIFDPQNGYTAISRSALEKIPLEKVAPRYDFENDLLIWLALNDAKIKDINIPARYGIETSTIKLIPFIGSTVRTLVRGFARRLWFKEVLRTRFFAMMALVLGLVSAYRLSFIGGVHKALIGMYSGFPGRNGDHMYYVSMALQFAGKSLHSALNMTAQHFHDWPGSASALSYGYLDTHFAPLVYPRQTLTQLLSLGYRVGGFSGLGAITFLVGLASTVLLVRWALREWGRSAAWASIALALGSTFYLWYSTGLFIESLVILIEVAWLYTLPISRHYKATVTNLVATNFLIVLLAITRQFPILPISILAAGWFATYLRDRAQGLRTWRNAWFLPAIVGTITSGASYLIVNFWAPYVPESIGGKKHFSAVTTLHYLGSIATKDPVAWVIIALAIYGAKKAADKTLGWIAIAVFLGCSINVYLATTEYRYWIPLFVFVLPIAADALASRGEPRKRNLRGRYDGRIAIVASGAALVAVVLLASVFYGKGDGRVVASVPAMSVYHEPAITGQIVCYSNEARIYLERSGFPRIALSGSAIAHAPTLDSSLSKQYRHLDYVRLKPLIDRCLLR